MNGVQGKQQKWRQLSHLTLTWDTGSAPELVMGTGRHRGTAGFGGLKRKIAELWSCRGSAAQGKDCNGDPLRSPHFAALHGVLPGCTVMLLAPLLLLDQDRLSLARKPPEDHSRVKTTLNAA